jgi:TetR/AcrR family transcriptional repressor of mexJK operon
VLDTTSRIDVLVDEVADGLRDPDDLQGTLLHLARRFTQAVMEPDTLRLRRLVIAEAERFTELGTSWYENGFERVLATLAERFTDLAAAGRLSLDDARLAAEHFVGLLLWIPVNRAMFTGDLAPFDEGERERMLTAGVAAFLRAYAPVPG